MPELPSDESSISTTGADRGIVLERYAKLESLADFITSLDGDALVDPRAVNGERRWAAPPRSPACSEAVGALTDICAAARSVRMAGGGAIDDRACS